MKTFIAKDDSWFDTGTVVKLITLDVYPGCDDVGLFEGYHDGRLDQEICPLDEFTVETGDEST